MELEMCVKIQWMHLNLQSEKGKWKLYWIHAVWPATLNLPAKKNIIRKVTCASAAVWRELSSHETVSVVKTNKKRALGNVVPALNSMNYNHLGSIRDPPVAPSW